MTEYYLFATFVFILCLGMLIVMKFMFKIDKSDGKSPNMKEKEAKVLKLYEQIEDMLEGFEEYAEEVREEIGNAKANADNADKGGLDEDKIDELIGEILDRKLDNKVSEAVRRIVTRSVRDEVEGSLDEIVARIEKLENSKVSIIDGRVADTSVKEFMPDEFAKTPETLEELGESIEKAMKSKSGSKSKSEKRKERKKVMELYDSGMSINDIAKEVGLASSEIKLIIELMN